MAQKERPSSLRGRTQIQQPGFEASNPTQSSSFELAGKRLGGRRHEYVVSHSSIRKGETLMSPPRWTAQRHAPDIRGGCAHHASARGNFWGAQG